jgi:hypothetical protein
MDPSRPPLPLSRLNEYFIPRDGIDIEVITADICRYLGNDAEVRPGTYEVSSPVVNYLRFDGSERSDFNT